MNTQTATIVKDLIRNAIFSSISYDYYRNLVSDLAAKGDTTGEKTEANIGYTLLNNRRMKRWDKTLKLSGGQENLIKSFKGKVVWLVLTESWCGDAAPTLPAMNKIANLNKGIELKILLRDDHPKLMDQFMTNGARSIPKLIMLDNNTMEVVGEWGPRPRIAAQMVKDYKVEHGKLTAEFREQLQVWYNKDKGQSSLKELIALLALENVSYGTNL